MYPPNWLLETHRAVIEQGIPQEPELYRRMVQKGHPLAAEYRQILVLYESLPYFAGRNSRFYSAQDPHNYSIISSPALKIDYDVTRERLQDVLELHARNGWQYHPQVYGLTYGSWAISTTDAALVRDAQALGMTIEVTQENGAMELHRLNCNGASFEAVRALIDRHHAGHRLGHCPSTPAEAAGRPSPAKLLDDLRLLESRQDAWL